MKRLLVPTDFSIQAENALKVAAQIARKFDGEIFLLHMLELPMQLTGTAASGSAVGSGGNQNLPEALYFMKLARKRFQEMMSLPFLEGIKVHETVQFHQAFEGIMEVSDEHNCDLIVMGSHGATGLKEMFIGSNTEKVVRNSHIPVLVIKNTHEVFDIQNIVFATDCEMETKHTFEQATEFAKSIGAKIHVVFVNTANSFKNTKDAQGCLTDFVQGVNFQDYTLNIYNDVTVEKGILNFARSINAGLIAISTHGRKGLSHFFNGSISEDLVNHANQPVITFKI